MPLPSMIMGTSLLFVFHRLTDISAEPVPPSTVHCNQFPFPCSVML
jgi:hypothetical protein